MKNLAIVLAAVIALAACGHKKEEAPPQKPDEIRALEKAKETAKKLNEKTKETNDAAREANEQKSDSTKSDSQQP
jgi:nitrous oxide reductase accessory protein NosL